MVAFLPCDFEPSLTVGPLPRLLTTAYPGLLRPPSRPDYRAVLLSVLLLVGLNLSL
jgi:hypothetical protein